MPSYRIFRLSARQAESFRNKPPKSDAATLKPGCYEAAGSIEAAHPYAAWKILQQGEGVDAAEGPEGDDATANDHAPLEIGDVLVPEEGEPLLLNYWGFDAAQWLETPSGDDAQETTVDEVVEQAV